MSEYQIKVSVIVAKHLEATGIRSFIGHIWIELYQNGQFIQSDGIYPKTDDSPADDMAKLKYMQERIK